MSEHRITFHLDRDLNSALLYARAEDGIPAAERIRAALTLWADDDAVRAQINNAAKQLQHRAKTAAAPDARVKATLSLTQSRMKDLARARADDRIPAATRIRGALDVWRHDSSLRARIDELAGQLRHARMTARSVELGAAGHR